MFKKQQRLDRTEFSKYFKSGERKHLPHLTIITKSTPTTKVSVVVGKKVAKSAVRRNLLKRRVYADLKNLLKEVNPITLIVLLKPSFNSLSRKEAAEFIHKTIAQVIKSK